MDGTASVSRDGEAVGSLGPGDTFGEVALLGDDVVRTATVTATTDMTLEVMTPAEMREMLDRAPQIADRLQQKMAGYQNADPTAGD